MQITEKNPAVFDHSSSPGISQSPLKRLSVWLRTSSTATRQAAQLLVPTRLRMSWLLTPVQ